MEEKKYVEPMPEEEFKDKAHEMAEANKKKLIDDFYQGVIYFRNFMGVSLFKSVRRAVKRGHMSIFGDVFPKRPFNNRKRDRGDTYNKRRIYEQLTNKKSKIC